MKYLFALIICSSLLCCSNEKPNGSIIGTWAGIFKGEYIEYQFDSTTVFIFAHWQANMGSVNYEIEDDSLRYIEFEYVAGIEWITDNSIVLSNESQYDTLYRISQSSEQFNKLNVRDSVEFYKYIEEYNKRANRFYRERGLHSENPGEWNEKPKDELLDIEK